MRQESFPCVALQTNEWNDMSHSERWGAGVETQKNVREEIGGWGRVPFNEPYAPLLSTIYVGAEGSLNLLEILLDPSPPPLVIRTCVMTP